MHANSDTTDHRLRTHWSAVNSFILSLAIVLETFFSDCGSFRLFYKLAVARGAN